MWEGRRKWQLELTITSLPWKDRGLYTHLPLFPECLLWAGRVSVLKDEVTEREEVLPPGVSLVGVDTQLTHK